MVTMSALLFSFSLLLLSPSGIFAGVYHDAAPKPSAFIRTNKNFNIQSLVFRTVGTSTPTSVIPTNYLFLNPSQATKWVETNSYAVLPSLNISAIVVIGDEKSLIPSLSSLKLIYTFLRSSGINSNLKVSIVFSLSSIANMAECKNKYFDDIARFINNTGSFMLIETSLDNDFVDLITSIPNLHVPSILHLKGSISEIEIPKFKLRLLKKRIFGLLSEEKSSQKVIASYHRELAEFLLKSINHDAYDQVPNLTPITVPSYNPAPPVVTVLPTNPTMPTGTIPPLNPYPTPITVPATNPLPTPVTNPVTTPATNPVTTYPSPYPQTGTGTVPTYVPPVTMPGTVPVGTLPGGTSTAPVSGQMWCVARSGIPDAELQPALDYACGIGGADCTALQPMGSCYNPNSVQAHASYAFNSYYQRNPTPTSCDFGGAGMLTNVNPSVGTCMFPSSSMTSGYSPTTPATSTTPGITPAPIYGTGTGVGTGAGVGTGIGTGTGIGAGTNTGTSISPGSAALNSGSNSAFGTDNPTGATSSSVSHSASSKIVLFISVFIYLIGNV